jgi:hypothetical protein
MLYYVSSTVIEKDCETLKEAFKLALNLSKWSHGNHVTFGKKGEQGENCFYLMEGSVLTPYSKLGLCGKSAYPVCVSPFNAEYMPTLADRFKTYKLMKAMHTKGVK